jgi:hypothetical protein
MEDIRAFKACCKKEFNNKNYYLKVGIEYNCIAMRTQTPIIVTSDGVNELFTLDRFYEHFYTKKEYRKIKLENLKNAI